MVRPLKHEVDAKSTERVVIRVENRLTSVVADIQITAKDSTMNDKLTAYDKLTDAKKAAIWQKGRDAGESVKTIRLNRTGHGPSAALREWHRLIDAGLLKDSQPKRGRPNGGTKAAVKKAAPAKKAPAARKVVSQTKRQPAKRATKATAPKAETA